MTCYKMKCHPRRVLFLTLLVKFFDQDCRATLITKLNRDKDRSQNWNGRHILQPSRLAVNYLFFEHFQFSISFQVMTTLKNNINFIELLRHWIRILDTSDDILFPVYKYYMHTNCGKVGNKIIISADTADLAQLRISKEVN